MKMGMRLSFGLLFALALIFLGGCASEKYIPTPNEEMYGTWISEQGPRNGNAQKNETFAGGFGDFHFLHILKPYEEGTQEIASKWTDSEGNVWYKVFGTATTGEFKGHSFQHLAKISKSGTQREIVWNSVTKFDPNNYPKKIDPDDPHYQFFIRAGN